MSSSELESTTTTTTTGAAEGKPAALQVAVASYDLAAGAPGRFLVGMFDTERGAVGYGGAKLQLFFLGENDTKGTPEPKSTAEGRYVSIPGSSPPPADTSKAVFLTSADKGVYEAEVTFDRPGFWGVEAAVDVEGKTESARAGFKVLPAHEVPAAGETAPASRNLTVSSSGVDPAAIDSRAGADKPVPDEALHQTTVADALAAKRPVLLVVSTPTFCVSRFCGPITDEAAKLAETYSDRAAFIHVEVWKDFDQKQLNDAAAEWISTSDGGAQEPWVFLIGADGKIVRRFDNVATREAIEPLLQALPKL